MSDRPARGCLPGLRCGTMDTPKENVSVYTAWKVEKCYMSSDCDKDFKYLTFPFTLKCSAIRDLLKVGITAFALSYQL